MVSAPCAGPRGRNARRTCPIPKPFSLLAFLSRFPDGTIRQAQNFHIRCDLLSGRLFFASTALFFSVWVSRLDERLCAMAHCDALTFVDLLSASVAALVARRVRSRHHRTAFIAIIRTIGDSSTHVRALSRSVQRPRVRYDRADRTSVLEERAVAFFHSRL